MPFDAFLQFIQPGTNSPTVEGETNDPKVVSPSQAQAQELASEASQIDEAKSEASKVDLSSAQTAKLKSEKP